MALIDKHTYQSGETMIVFTGAIGGSSIIIYKADVSGFVFASGIGDDPLEIPLTADIFPLGHYVIVNTKEPNGCTTLTLDECREDPDFISKSSFKIVD